MRRTSAIVAAALAALVSIPPGAAAQQQTLEATMRVVDFQPWNDAQLPLRFTVEVTNTGGAPIEDPVVRTTIYSRVLSRSALHVALDGRRLRNVVAATTDEIGGPVAPGAAARLEVTHDLTDLANTFRRGQGGIYPVEITLSGSDRELATGITALVFFGSARKERLNVSIVLPVHRPAAFAADGSYLERSLEADLGSDGFVARTAALVASAAGGSLTIAPSGLLLDELADIADGYRRRAGSSVSDAAAEDAYALAAAKALADLKTAAASPSIEVATTPYAWADLVPLVHGGLGADALRQVTLGRSAVEAALGRPPSTETLVPAGLRMDARAAAAIATLGVRRMVVAADVLPPQPGIFGPDQPLTARASSGTDYAVLLSDVATAERMTNPGEADRRLLAQGVVAETAMAWFEAPGRADERTMAIAPPSLPEPGIVEPVVTALSSAPWVQLRTLADTIGAVPASEDPQKLVVGEAADRSFVSAVRSAARSIDTLARVIVSPRGATEDLERLLLAAQSHDWAEQPGHARELATAAGAGARRLLDKIVVVPPDPDERDPGRRRFRKVTLTSRAGPLPVTVRNDTGFVVSVKIRLSSAKVAFAEPTHTIERLERRETVTFTASARASGLSPVRVDLLTPDGDALPVGTGTVLVQSTAVSAVALAATGGGAAFLVAAWLRRGRRRRRNAAARPAASEEPGGGKTG